MPPAQPTPSDVAAVATAIGETPAAPQAAPQPQVAPQPQMQPAPVTPQPAPSQQPQDPFSTMFASEPPAPAAPPVAPPVGTPTEPTAPTTPPVVPPVAPPVAPPAEPQAPGQQPAPDNSAVSQGDDQGDDQYESFEEYMKRVTGDAGTAPTAPDPEKIDPNDPAAIKGFFDDLVNTAVERAGQEMARKQAIHNAERLQWDAAFGKYGSLRTNKKARDLVHSIRMGYFQRGKAITPTQAADILLESMGQQYQAGIAANQVQTTIEQVQPQGGGTATPVPTTLDEQSILERVQTGGETALADILDAEIKAGRL